MATHGAVMSEHFRAVNGGPGKPQATCTHCSQTVPPIGRDSKHRSVQYLLVGAHAALCNAVQPTPSEDFTALERRYGNPQGSYSRLADHDERVSTAAPCSMSMKESLKMSRQIESEFQQLCMKAAVTMRWPYIQITSTHVPYTSLSALYTPKPV